jgi:hypothetical protein
MMPMTILPHPGWIKHLVDAAILQHPRVDQP